MFTFYLALSSSYLSSSNSRSAHSHIFSLCLFVFVLTAVLNLEAFLSPYICSTYFTIHEQHISFLHLHLVFSSFSFHYLFTSSLFLTSICLPLWPSQVNSNLATVLYTFSPQLWSIDQFLQNYILPILPTSYLHFTYILPTFDLHLTYLLTYILRTSYLHLTYL